MPQSFHLNPRLAQAAAFVRRGSRLADIGTDHAALPAALVAAGYCPRALACDLRAGPLRNAENTVREAGLSAQIELRRCDGLAGILADEADDIAICGMGGELIIRILSDCEWLCAPGKRWILQPMRDAHKVREFLCRSGFALCAERAVLDGKHCYMVTAAEYIGQPAAASALFYHTGLLVQQPGEAERVWLLKELSRLKKRQAGLHASAVGSAGIVCPEDELIDQLAALYRRLFDEEEKL